MRSVLPASCPYVEPELQEFWRHDVFILFVNCYISNDVRFSGPMLSTRLESKQKDFEERYDQIFNVNNKVRSLDQFCTFHKLFFAVSRVIFPTVALLPRNPEFNFPNQKYLYLLLDLCPRLWGCT